MSHHHVLQNGSDIRGIAIATDEYAVNQDKLKALI